LAEVLLRK